MARTLPSDVEIILGLDDPDDDEALRARVGRAVGVSSGELPPIRLLKSSIDARQGRVRFRLTVGIEGAATGTDPALARVFAGKSPRPVDDPGRVAIVGAGPAGLWCAYELARAGIGSTILERGKPVRPRRRDLRGLTVEGHVDPDSNYCFGEGGAGTYSDGKLYTRSHKRGDVRDVIEILAQHGAPDGILTDARPHIGSNRLPQVVTALRERLEAVGVRFRFDAHVSDLHVDGGRVRGVELAHGGGVSAEAVVLATGHSARDVLEGLERRGVRLEPKGFALGARIEHPQPLIDSIQYGRAAGHARLPSAPYRLAHEVEGRGVFSFCMCPGGFIVPAATEPDGVVVNGMSLSRRNSPYANSGLVVSVTPEDVAAAGFPGPLGGIALQRALEQEAARQGGGRLVAPAVRVTDFLAGRSSSTLPKTSYRPGIGSADLDGLLDGTGLQVASRLREALSRFDRRMRGYVTEEGVLIGVESRTSSPVRIPRTPEGLESPDLPGLHPCGEGAGYAGGIVSAALDGIRVGRAVAERLGRSGRRPD
ncbi:MAG: FAD-dependent oxidoreductase [Candidatus Binatia bacterium]|nr:FAD-dependent oxidoreductase [Candidatus Binatia bacterium]